MNHTTAKRPRIGVGVLVWHQGRLLLGERIRRGGENSWQFPGGHLEFGESIVQCARREAYEEAGIELDGLSQCGYTNVIFNEPRRHYVTLFVTARLSGGVPAVKEPDKCLQWQWFDHDRLPQPLFLPIRNFLKEVHDLGRFCVDPHTPAGVHR